MAFLWDFEIKIYKEEDGSYYWEVVNLPGCFTMGETLEDLNKNLKEAIASYILSLQKDLINFNFHISNKDVIHA